MSKKVLNYAGRRPMLLALIMATAILGLLFSGWLTPTPGRAQGTGGGNPQANQENTNCVATTNAWSGSCPSIVTNGSVSPTTIYQCGVTGPEMPTNIVVPVYSPTNIFTQIITYSTTNCTPVTNTESITYSVSGYFWTNFSSPYTSMPSKVTNSFNADCDVYVTSSDTNNCASPGLVNLATVTWNLPCPTITNCTLQPTPPEYSGMFGATIGYNFQCVDGWYSWECFPVYNNTCCSVPPSTAPNAGYYIWNDNIYTPDTGGGSCSVTAHQIIHFAPVGGGSCTNENSVCSFENDISLVITQTNAPSTPAHGTIVISVTIGGGLTTTSTY